MRRLQPITAFALAALAAVVLSSSLSSAALGHVPTLERAQGEGAAVIEGPDVSRAIYGYLAPVEEYDSYTFHVDEPVTQTVGIIVSARAEHAGFRPALRLLADGTEVVAAQDPGLPDRETEWEPFSLTSFWAGAEERVSFEPDVAYELVVDPGTGTDLSGRYVIVFGGPEAFTATDALRTLAYLPVIWFGAYGGAPPHWNWWALIPLGIVAGGMALIVRAVVRALRRRPGHASE